MKFLRQPHTLRARLTLFYVGVLALLLAVYAVLVFAFQYVSVTRQMLHDEVQDVVTVEGLLYFDANGTLQLHQDYFSRPQSHLLVDRLMEVLDESTGKLVYRSDTLHDMSLGGPLRHREGDKGFDERIVQLADGTHVFVISHVHGLNGHSLVLRLGYDLAPFHQRMLQFAMLLLIGIPLALALAALAGQAIARRALRPLEAMTLRAESITAANLHDRLDEPRDDDELGHLARVFNRLLQRLEQAFAQLQRFTADAAHELRTPLASVRALGEVSLGEERSPESYRDTLGDILEETARLNATIESLLLLARAETTQPGPQQTTFAAQPLVAEVLSLLEVMLEERDLRVVASGTSEASNALVHADRSLLRTAFLNILHNAVKFSPRGSTIAVTYEMPSPELLRIILADQGPGIEAGEHQRIFERFYTSPQATATGAGIGLAIVKLVIERSRGSVRFDEASTSGARCIIELPIAQPDAA